MKKKNEMKGIEKYLNTITNNFENIDINIGDGNSEKLPKKLYDVLNDLELMDEFQDLKEWYQDT